MYSHTSQLHAALVRIVNDVLLLEFTPCKVEPNQLTLALHTTTPRHVLGQPVIVADSQGLVLQLSPKGCQPNSCPSAYKMPPKSQSATFGLSRLGTVHHHTVTHGPLRTVTGLHYLHTPVEINITEITSSPKGQLMHTPLPLAMDTSFWSLPLSRHRRMHG